LARTFWSAGGGNVRTFHLPIADQATVQAIAKKIESHSEDRSGSSTAAPIIGGRGSFTPVVSTG
jgi:hypothetical protein